MPRESRSMIHFVFQAVQALLYKGKKGFFHRRGSSIDMLLLAERKKVTEAWRLLAVPGVLFGDDWSWFGSPAQYSICSNISAVLAGVDIM